MRTSLKQLVSTTLLLLLLGVLAVAVFAGAGLYNFAADAPHSSPIVSLIDFARQRSIAHHAGDIPVPDLGDPGKIKKGAGNYDAMCAQCHLSPAGHATELSKGLYPAPPNLAKATVQPGTAFWVIKHGIKASGMPAWGTSMPDEDIWNIVAFLEELPKLSPQRYQELVAQSEGHSHDASGSAASARAGEAKPVAPKHHGGHQH